MNKQAALCCIQKFYIKATRIANRIWPAASLTQIITAAFVICLLTACGSAKNTYKPEHRYAPFQLQEDASTLWQTFRQCHPSLYWFTPRDTLDPAFEKMIASLTDSLTELQFRLKLSETVALIRCGHTSVRNSKAAARYRPKHIAPFFPLQVKTWNGDSMIILANAFRNDSILIRGTSIHAINGKPVKEIIDTMCRFISADGLHNNFKYQLISNNFPAFYKSIIGLGNVYQLAVTTIDGKQQNVSIKNFDPVYEDSLRKAALKTHPGGMPPVPVRMRGGLQQDRKLTIDTARSLAIMELNTFSHARLPSFFRHSFKTMRKNKIQHLAIELRENGGGNIMNSTRLARYLCDHPFKVADTVAAKSLHYPYPSFVKNGILYKIQSWFVTTRRSDDRLHYRIYERKFFTPFERNHFDGSVFILTGGFTFSASTLFIDPLKEQKNITVVGEETGGGAYGNTAVNVPDLRLPNTGVRVRLPLYRLVVNKDMPHNGRGIVPDVIVPPSSWHLAKRLDPKMLKVHELIDKH
jgi:hypothetical protein